MSIKSTNVRSLLDAPLRGWFRLLGVVTPGLAAAQAERLFFTPPRPRRSRRIERLLASAKRFTIAHRPGRLAAWAWGSGPSVYLVHGWGGRGGQLADFVPPLVDRGRRVIAFDAPAHGASRGRLSSIPEFARALAAVTEVCGPPEGVVGHSLGCAAATFAMSRGLDVGRAVFVAPPADPVRWVRGFARRLGLGPELLAAMQARSERRLGIRWSELPVPGSGVDFETPLLVVHDRDDAEVPWSDGAAVAAGWPGARLVTTRGLGHRRILRDAGVIAEALAFLVGEPWGIGSLDGRSLDAYLYQRDARRAAAVARDLGTYRCIGGR
jgi:pimeloyl-ACP methyl ester carboxylesterase